MCAECWNERNPDRQATVIREEFRDEKPETCCYCGKPHNSGIYKRENPDLLFCKGIHEVPA